MINNQILVRQILLFIIVPLALALFITTISFYRIQKNQTIFFENQLFDFVEASVRNPPYKEDLLQNSTVLEHLLQLQTIQFLSTFQPDSKQLINFGLPLKLPEKDWDPESMPQWRTRNVSYRAFQANENQWLIAGISNHDLIINEYKSVFFVILISVITLAFITFFATKLHQSIVNPLQSLVVQTRKLLTQELHEPISLQQPGVFDELIDIINEIVHFQKSIQDEMRSFSEQSTKELRETLETVEIQNIELDIARKNALQASKAKSEFLANTSHELRTPLNGILGFTSLLLKTDLSNQQRDYLSTIEQSSQGLLTVINDILDFSKLETGQLTLEYKPVSLHEIIEEVFHIYAPSAHEKNLRLLSMVHKNLQHNLLGDPHRIKQVITNLVTNAIKFSTRGCIIVRASSLSETDNRTEIKISITDNGIGLTEEQQTQLFTAFSKVDSSDSRLQGGAGLGLAIAKGLINRMQGEIGIESSPNKGSCFWFTLRLGIDKTRPSTSALQNSLYGINALVYDANTDSRAEVTHHLSEWGIFYREEKSLIDIENPLAETRHKSGFDIVILDAYTDINSFDRDKLLRIIHNINARYQIPVIILAPSSIQRLLQDDILGLNTMIVLRPIQQAYLHQAISNQLNIVQPLKAPDKTLISEHHHATGRKKIHVLVVEDNPANLKLVSEFLKGLGVQISAAENGYSALQLCEKQIFDLIFMDVQMPGIDGLETTRQLRARESHERTPIIALTAHAVDEQKTRLLLAGMDDYLSKPVSERDLRQMLKRWTTAFTDDPPKSEFTEEDNSEEESPEEQNRETRLKIFDWSESMTLAKNKPDLARDMLTMLVDSIETTREETTKAFNQQNWAVLIEVVHKFHGGCCYCGVPALRQASKQVEDALYAKNQSAYGELIGKMFEEIDNLLAWLENYDLQTLFSDE